MVYYLYYFILFILGLAIGSFVNVIALRYKAGKRLLTKDVISGRSYCPHCKETLSWYELVPFLSFIFLKGKCRHCGKKISLQYSLVELISGLFFVFIPFSLTHQAWPLIIAWLLVFSVFLLLSIIDFRLSIIPDNINILLAILGFAIIGINNHYQNFSLIKGSFMGYYAALFGWREDIWLNHIFGAVFGLVLFGLIIVLSRGRAMGWGDVKLAAALGFIFGWPDILMALMLAFIIGAIFSVILMIVGKKSVKDMIPFGPFLIIGSAVVFFFGYQIIYGYFKLFGMI